jgi:radical SAM superfamily enzyme YgiQ (UPF0313 family)
VCKAGWFAKAQLFELATADFQIVFVESQRMIATSIKNRFVLILIRPSHYDDDGYIIQWFRSAIPSNTLAVMNGLAQDCNERRVLGHDVEMIIEIYDESNARIRPEPIAKQIGRERGLVALVGVQSNQFPRAIDLARSLRAKGIQVCIGGFHVSGCLAMLPDIPSELREAMDIGISLFAGEAEGCFDTVLRDAWQGKLQPLYNYIDQRPELEGAAVPLLPVSRIKRTSGRLTSFDAGRGCPFKCSFCTIINVHGQKTRLRTADDVEQIVRRNLAQGINRFFITDDNFARNRGWEGIFDRLIAMREQERLNLKFVIQVDTQCHRIPRFIEKSARAGVARVFIGLESIRQENLVSVDKPQNKIAEYRRMLLKWKQAGVTVFAGYIIGFPGDTPESVLLDVGTIQRELPVDLVEFHCLTPLPGSKDHQRIYCDKGYLEPDLNKFDLEHVTAAHPTMSKSEWEKVYRDAWDAYYTPEHMMTIMRRSVATKSNPGNMLMLLAWFYLCFTLEKTDPLQGGYCRRKYRKDRRPGFPRESALGFYARYLGGLVYKHFKLAGLILRLGRFRRQLKRDPSARHYLDLAITPSPEE